MDSVELAQRLKEVLDEKKGVDIELMDLRERATFTDFFLVVTGTSTTHVASLADEIDRFAHLHGVAVVGNEGGEGAQWVLVDLGDVVVHIFLAEARELYSLDKLWSHDTMLLHKIRDDKALDEEIFGDDTP